MKNLKKAELAVISLTILCLVFTAGFFVGRSMSDGVVTIQRLAPSDPLSAAGASAGSGAPENAAELRDPGQAGETAPDGDASPSGSTAAAAYADTGDKSTGPININTAGAAELDELPGIGEVLSERIIEYRTANGGFKSVEEIMAVSGIGEKKYGDIKDMITVG